MVSNTSQMSCETLTSLCCYMRMACVVFQRILSFLSVNIWLCIWQIIQVRPLLAINFHTAKMEMYCVCQSSHSFAHSALYRYHNVDVIVIIVHNSIEFQNVTFVYSGVCDKL